MFLSEARVREIITDEMASLVSRSYMNDAMVSDLRNQYSLLNKKVKDCEDVAHDLRNLLGMLKMPLNSRMQQFKNGINLLTEFANELQRDIDSANENARPK